jgi:hypothetical protein
VNPTELTILTADTDAACDPETGTCAIPQTSIPGRPQAPDLARPAPDQEPPAG